MNITQGTIQQIYAMGARNEARLALGEAEFAASSARRLICYAASRLSGEGAVVTVDEVSRLRAIVLDALKAIDALAPAEVAYLEAAE